MYVSIKFFNLFEFFIVPKSDISWSVWHDYHVIGLMQRHTLWYEHYMNQYSTTSTIIKCNYEAHIWLWQHDFCEHLGDMLSFFGWRFWHYDVVIRWFPISNPYFVQSRGQRRPVEPHHLLRCHGRFAVGHWLRSGCGLHGCLGTVLCRYLPWIVGNCTKGFIWVFDLCIYNQ